MFLYQIIIMLKRAQVYGNKLFNTCIVPSNGSGRASNWENVLFFGPKSFLNNILISYLCTVRELQKLYTLSKQ